MPPGVGANISLQVQVGGQWSNPVPLGYVAPTVLTVIPQSGPTVGGTALTVAGTNWGGVTDPTFFIGGSPCPLIPGSYIPSPGQTVSAQCTLPRGQGLGLLTTVVIGGQSSLTQTTASYTYAPPSVASVAPASGPTSGRQTPAMVIEPISGAVSFVPGARIVMTVCEPRDRLWYSW